jgi:hypothetical protein
LWREARRAAAPLADRRLIDETPMRITGSMITVADPALPLSSCCDASGASAPENQSLIPCGFIPRRVRPDPPDQQSVLGFSGIQG